MSPHHKCLKCGAKVYGINESGVPQIKCPICGLFHTVKSCKESLKKQVLGDNYINPLGGN